MTRRQLQVLAACGLLFFAARIAVTSVAFAQIDRTWQRQLAALDRIEPGSRVLALDYSPCLNIWATDRLDHISSLATVRRDAFTNGQFVIPGALMLKVTYRAGAPFIIDPSHLVRQEGCGPGPVPKIWDAVAVAPRAFDYLWMVGIPETLWPKSPDLVPIWQTEGGILYRTSARPLAAPISPSASSPE